MNLLLERRLAGTAVLAPSVKLVDEIFDLCCTDHIRRDVLLTV